MAGVMYEKDETAISKAILDNDLEGLKIALGNGEDPHYKDRKGNTYLHYLSTMNRPYLVHVLVGSGIELNAVNRHGNTALHVTALQSECCHAGDLMAAGIDARIKNKDGKTAAEITTKNSFWKKVYERYEPGIFEAIDSHDVDKVLYLLNCWSRVDTLRDGLTLRQFAACRKFHDLVSHIDSYRHSLNAIYSVLEGSPDKAWTFLSNGKCNVNLLNTACESKHILQEAITLANIRLVRMICKSKVNVNIRVRLKNFFKAPLYFAVLNPQVSNDIMWTVLRSGCDFTLRDERGRNAAIHALDRWKGETPFEVFTFMMKNGLDVSHRDATGVTLRDVARFYRRKDILTLIDKAYVKVIRTSNIPELERMCVAGYDSMLIYFNYRDTFIYASGNETDEVLDYIQWIPTFLMQVRRLFQSIRHKSMDEVSKVFKGCQRPDLLINAKDKGGHCPIHLAVLHWRFDVLKLLLKMPGIDIDAQDNCGKTALHYACCVEEDDERTEFCSILRQAGIDQEKQDFMGHKATDYVGDISANNWLAKERKVCYGMPRQLACVDKYEELYRMMRGKGKTIRHFNESVRCFRYPVPQLHNILSSLMPRYRDLLHVSMDYGKEDIAVRLVKLGNSLSVVTQVDTVSTSESSKVERRNMNALERARHLDMTKLVGAIEKRVKYKREKMEREKSLTDENDKGFGHGREGKTRLDKIRRLSQDVTEPTDVLFEEEEVYDSDETDDDDDENGKDNDDDNNDSIGSFYSDNFDDDDDDDFY